jgi:hypothetical protein
MWNEECGIRNELVRKAEREGLRRSELEGEAREVLRETC